MSKSRLFTIPMIFLGALSSIQCFAASKEMTTHQWDVIESYCFECHNDQDWAGSIAFNLMSSDQIAHESEIWEEAIRKLRGGLMPPPGADRPDEALVTDLVAWLENEIDSSFTEVQPGRVSLRRFNRREYANVIRDLLAMNIDAEALLPLDDKEGGYDNNGSVLQVSPSFVDQYIYAARTVAHQAVGNRDARAVTTTYGDVANMEISLSPRGGEGTGKQQHHIEGMPFGTRGGFIIEHDFPVDGDYTLTIGDLALAREVPRMEFENTVIASLDGKEIFRTVIGGEKDHKAIDQIQDLAVAEINGRLRSIPFKATAGQHKVAVTFLHRGFSESDERRRSIVIEGGQARIHGLHSLQIRGPLSVSVMSESASRQKVFVCQPLETMDEAPCAKEIISNLARNAFRRPVTNEDINGLMTFYESGYADGGFETGVRDALSAILASPYFLYRAESGDDAIATVTLADLELASRLSFFLWSSIPDEELLELAIDSRLGEPEILAQQVSRMLADPRSKSLIEGFAYQWLNLAKLDEITPDRSQFPQANGTLDPRNMFKQELSMFIDSVLRSDSSVLELLTADYTYLNERLAMHYGIENVKGSHFRREKLADSMRYGLLGKGAILMLTANPNRTSPVIRGAWILERILGTPPAEPPPNVENLPENAPGQVALTVRQRMEKHRDNPSCFGCHGVMDPLGLALENFDTVGQYRSHDPQTLTMIDSTGVLPNGTPISGPDDLRQALVSKPDQFVQAFTENLLTYALGRSIDHHDMPAIRRIVREAAEDNYRFEAIVLNVVNSEAFRKRATTSISSNSAPAQQASIQINALPETQTSGN